MRRSALAALLAFATGLVAADSLRIAGTGSGSALLDALRPAYARQYAGDQLTVLMPPLGSGGALRALRAGAIDVAIVVRPPEGEAASGFDARPVARSPIVLATADGVRRKGFAVAELAALYGGQIATWDDGRPLRLILRSATESDTRALQALSPGLAASIGGALARPGATIAENDLDALDWLEKTSGTIGTTTLGLILTRQSRVRPLPLDGIVPGLDTLASGAYPLAKPLALVWKRPTPPAVARLLAWLRSADGKAALRSLGYLPEAP